MYETHPLRFHENEGKFRVKTELEQQIWNECARFLTNCIIFYNAYILSALLTCNGLQSKRTGPAISAFSGPHYVPLSLPSGPHYVPLSLQSAAPACNQPCPAHINCHYPGSQRQACPQHPIS